MNPFAQLATPIIRRPGDFIPEEAPQKSPPKRRLTRQGLQARVPTSRGLYPEIDNPWSLTPMECEVLRQTVTGKTQADISRDIGRSKKTIATHADRLKDKMEAMSMAHAAVLWDRFARDLA